MLRPCIHCLVQPAGRLIESPGRSCDRGEGLDRVIGVLTAGQLIAFAHPSRKVTVPTTASKTREDNAAAEAEESAAQKAAGKPAAKKSASSAKKSTAAKKTGGRKKAADPVDEVLAEEEQEGAAPTEALEAAVAKALEDGDEEEVAKKIAAAAGDEENAAAIVENAKKAVKGEEVEEEETKGRGFVISNADDDDAPAVQVVSAGATADPVKDYLKQIGKVALLNAAQEVDLALRIEAGLYAEHKLAEDEIKDKRLRRDLELVIADGRRAKNHLLEANLRLVVSLAKRYTGRGMLFLDLIQEGNLGLIRAVEKFDYTKASSSPPTPPGGSARPSPAHGRPGPHHPHPRAHGGGHQQAGPRTAPDAAGPGPRTHSGGAGPGARHDP